MNEPDIRLTDRDREILCDVIATFVGTGEPVSSRRVAKLRRHGLSAATIRNIMADLEELGLLSQPHTSAGRVPTESGYHLYIDSLVPGSKLPAEQRRLIDDSLDPERQGGEELMSAATHLLSELSHQIGVVVVPAPAETELQALSFVRLSGRKVLCVLVASSGFVENKVIETPEPISREELLRISNYLSDHFAGQTPRQIRDRLLVLMAEERAQVDRLLADALDLARQALAATAEPELLFEGTNAVLAELSDVQRVRRLLDTFADKARLVQLLTQLVQGRSVRVVIGGESELTSGLDFSLVAKPYGTAARTFGTLGVFGPTRMDYPRAIPLVNYLGDRLSQALQQSLGEAV